MAESDPALRIADLELIRLIGSGSYGDVWLARGVTGAFRAVKVVWRNRFQDVRPYEREFEGITRFATISLREPSQLALLHAGRNEAEGYFYYVMELADDLERGREIIPETYGPLTLKEYAQKHGGVLSAANVVALGVQLARALGTLHVAGLVHRDIKPSNVIFVGGVPKLADVGLVANASAQLTFVGTEGFVPPEGPGVPAADVFSLGKVLYELATGCDRHEFPRLPADLAERPDRREFLELNEVILRACEPDAKNRFSDAGELLEELLLLQAGKSVRRLRSAERRLTRTLRIAAALAVIAAIAGTGAWVERRRANEEMQLRAKAEAERDALARRTVYAAMLTKAQEALKQEDFGRARRLLEEARPKGGHPDIRGCEWPVLWAEAQGDPAEIIVPEGPSIDRLALSPDGKFLGVHDESQTLRVYSLTDRKVEHRLTKMHRFGGFSADGARVLGTYMKTDKDYRLQAWNLQTEQVISVAEAGVFRPIKIGADGQLVSFLDGNPAALVTWTGQTDQVNQKLLLDQPEESGARFYRAALARRQPWVALAMVHGKLAAATWSLHVIDLRTGKRLYQEKFSNRISALEFGPEDKNIFCSFGNTAELAALQLTPMPKWLWRTPTAGVEINELALNAEETKVAAAGKDTRIQMFDVQSGASPLTLRGSAGAVLSMASVGENFFSSSADGELRSWENRCASPPIEFTGLLTGASGGPFFCLSPDGKRVVATANGQSARNVSLLEPTVPSTILPDVSQPLTFTADGKALWVFSHTGQLEKRELPNSGVVVARVNGYGAASVRSLPAVSADRCWLSFGLSDGNLVMVDLIAATQVWTLPAHHGAVWWTAVSPHGELVASSGEDRQVNLWRVATGERLATWAFKEDSVHADFSPDGRWLAVAGKNGNLQLIGLKDKRPLKTVFTGLTRIQSVKFSPASDRLALGGPDATLQMLETTGWSEVANFQARQIGKSTLEQTVDLIEFLPEGGWVAYLTDGRIKVWSANPARQIRPAAHAFTLAPKGVLR